MTDVARSLENWRPDNTRTWRRAVAFAVAGAGQRDQARVNCYGPSTVAGYMAGVGRSESKAWPAVLRQQLARRYAMESGTGVIYLHEPDPRVSAPGWTRAPYGPFLNSCLMADAPSDGPLYFGPVTATGFRVTYLAGPGAGVFTIVSDAPGQLPLTVDANAAAWQVRTTATPAGQYGAHRLTVQRSSGPVFVLAVEGYVGSTASWTPGGIAVTNVGAGSTVVANLLATGGDWTGSSLGAAVDANPCDLAIVAYAENSPGYQLPADMQTDMRVLLDRLRARGSDLLLCTSIDWQGEAANNLAPQEEYDAAVRELAVEYDVPLFDVAARWGLYQDSPAYYSDTIHPTPAGYADLALGLLSVITTGIGG
jgi:lysophospholipase L1-like esterase